MQSNMITSVSTMDLYNNSINNVHATSSANNLDNLLKKATIADLRMMKGEILDEVQMKLERFRESLEIETNAVNKSGKSRAGKNNKPNQLNRNHDSHSTDRPSELNSELGTTTKETHLDVIVDSSTQTDHQGRETVDPLRQKMGKLLAIRTKYSKSFTMHGVSYVLHGSWRERMAWLALLAVSVGCVYLMTSKMLTEFMEDTINERRYKEKVDNLPLPTFTICPVHNKSTQHNLPVDPDETRVMNEAEMRQCWRSKNCLNISRVNVYPNIMKDSEYKALPSDTIGRLGGYCFTFNPSGTLNQSKPDTSVKSVMILSSAFKFFYLYINPTGYNSSWNYVAYMSAGTMSVINLKKVDVKRIPQHNKPCVRINQTAPNIFNEHYSESSCFLECRLNQMYRDCSLVPARYHSVFKNKVMNFTSAADECAKKWTHDLQADEECMSGCVEACSSEKNTINRQSTTIIMPEMTVMQFKYEELYVERVTEYHAYSFATFFSNLGGTIGLMTGMSVLSLCEFIFCLCCMLGEAVLQIKLKMKDRGNVNSNQS